ncbi:MAG: hypothetical protein AAF502_00930 [Bacteroidota bacterium]
MFLQNSLVNAFSGWLDYGALGVMGICLILSYFLIRGEQQREGSGRKTILNSVYFFMAFSIIVGLLAIFIDLNVDGSENPRTGLLASSVVAQLNNQDAGYIFNNSGKINEQGLKLNLRDSIYQFFEIGENAPDFGDYKRSFEKKDNDQVHVMLDSDFSLGYLDGAALSDVLGSKVVATSTPTGRLLDVFGLFSKNRSNLAVKLGVDENQLKELFFEIIKKDNSRKEKLLAIKGLSNLFEELDYDEYNLLIGYINEYRSLPFKYWDLSQTYEGLIRYHSSKVDLKEAQANANKAYHDYILIYERNKSLYSERGDGRTLECWYYLSMRATGKNISNMVDPCR